ncbi:MAG: SseB family protein [Actinomycetota bacterium]
MVKDRRAVDSAGVPFAGRSVSLINEGDTGQADPILANALNTLSTDEELAHSFAQSRVLVPLLARRSRKVEGTVSAEEVLAITLVQPNGRRAFPVFSSLASLTRWNSAARPLPVLAQRAALAAVAQQCDVIFVDPANSRPRTLPRPAVWAISQGKKWCLPARDPVVLEAITRSAQQFSCIKHAQIEAMSGADIRIQLRLASGLPSERIDEFIRQWGNVLASNDSVRERVDAITMVLAEASEAP